MIDLDLTSYREQLRLKRQGDEKYLFDPIRRKWLLLESNRKRLVRQSEELVRQLLVQYLIEGKGYNQNRIKLEKGLKVNGLSKRCDVLVYDLSLEPFLLAECKAPEVAISQEVFRQIAWYNMPLRVPFLLVTNGVETYCCRMDYEAETFEFLEEVPDYPSPAPGDGPSL